MEDMVTRHVRKSGNEEYVTLVYPGGSAIMYGGTRVFNPAFHLNRWWQFNTRIEEGRKHFGCDLHAKKQNVIHPHLEIGDGFTLIRNSNTPHHDHRLFFPHQDCWSEEKIRTLGGLTNISGVIDYAMAGMMKEQQEYARLLCYVGPMMGMNQMDLHIHWLVNPDNTDPHLPFDALFDTNEELALKNYWRRRSQLVVFERDGVRAVCDSIFQAGQTFLVAEEGANVSSTVLSQCVQDILARFAANFTSHQGLAPDFTLMLEFLKGKLEWGYYIPYLNHIGYEQRTGFRKGVYVHPWGPNATYQVLKGEQST